MSVKKYYYEHFSELSPEKKFHFATIMNNFFKVHDFDVYLQNNKPSSDIKTILANNNYSKVSNLAVRRPFFEKYPDLYGVEAALFRVHHLMHEYNDDIRSLFVNYYPKNKLFELSDRLFNDKEALMILSTWAINTICLTEELFPRGRDVTKELSEWALTLDVHCLEPSLFVYLCTHIVICESNFYKKNLTKSRNIELMRALMRRTEEIVDDNIDSILLDPAIEYLVCCRMINIPSRRARNEIDNICKEYLKKAPYLVNFRRSSKPGSYFHTLNGAEHINSLYIMSGLDE